MFIEREMEADHEQIILTISLGIFSHMTFLGFHLVGIYLGGGSNIKNSLILA